MKELIEALEKIRIEAGSQVQVDGDGKWDAISGFGRIYKIADAALCAYRSDLMGLKRPPLYQEISEAMANTHGMGWLQSLCQVLDRRLQALTEAQAMLANRLPFSAVKPALFAENIPEDSSGVSDQNLKPFLKKRGIPSAGNLQEDEYARECFLKGLARERLIDIAVGQTKKIRALEQKIKQFEDYHSKDVKHE